MESRSTLVTVLAWIFIVGAGFASLVSAMQVIVVSTIFNGDELQSIPNDAPAMARFMSQYFHLFIYGFFTLAIFTLICAIALLKRKNWARLAFIAILAFGVIWQIVGLFMQFAMFSDFSSLAEGQELEGFERTTIIIRWFSFAIALATTGLFVWIIRKLTTQPIIGEFTLNKSSNSDGPKAAAGS